MPDDLTAARLAAARDAVASSRRALTVCRTVPWVSPAADEFRAALDDEGGVLAALLRALDDLLGTAGARPLTRAELASSFACWGEPGRSLRVGAGGFVSVDPAALADVAARLAAAAEQLDRADDDLLRVERDPLDGWAGAGGDGWSARARAAAGDLRRGWLSPGRAAGRVRRLSAGARSTATEHVAREQDLGRLLAGLGEAWWAGVRGRPVDAGVAALEAAADSGWIEAFVAGLAAPVRTALRGIAPGGPPVTVLAEPLARVATLLASPVNLVPVADPPQLPPPRGLAGLVGLVARSDDRAGPDGSAAAPPATVTVQRLDHVDGTRSWVVAVPGTQSLGAFGDVPTDMQTNVELEGGAADAMSAGVLEAMAAVGVGRDEPVVLAGHSQGGMVAMAVAAAVAGSHRVAGVVTAGSPTVPAAVPSSVPLVRLEHRQDAVPQVDGEPSVAGGNVTVVMRTLEGDRPVTSGTAHDVVTYVRTAGLVDEAVAGAPGSAPGVTAVTAALGGRGTSARTFQFRLTRDELAPPLNGSW